MAPPGKHGTGPVFYVHTTKKTLQLKAGQTSQKSQTSLFFFKYLLQKLQSLVSDSDTND
jgi:hypothetical protein